MNEFSMQEIVNATGGILLQGDSQSKIIGISIDSRQIKTGELFVAIKGERFDGHQFVEQAIQNGANGILIHENIDIPDGTAVIRVDNTLTALGDIARANRYKNTVPVIGITGSNGKTTTKDLVAGILEQSLKIIKNEGNYNNEIGLPLTLLKISQSTEAAVVEMGMRGIGQIKHLAEVAHPNIGIVTNIGLTHLELLGTQENIAKAKSELLEALPPDGLAILNGDDPLVRRMGDITECRTVLYGIDSPGLDYRAGEIKIQNNGSQFKVYFKGESFGLFIPVPGRHNILNALAAVALAKELGLDNDTIKRGLAKSEISGKRLRIIQSHGSWIIDDTYNASPTSVKAALDVLAELDYGKRKIAILADMLELGSESAAIHHEIGEYAFHKGVQILWGHGNFAKEYVSGFLAQTPVGIENRNAEYYPDKTLLLKEINELVLPGDVVLVKGSRGMKTEDVVAVLTKEETDE